MVELIYDDEENYPRENEDIPKPLYNYLRHFDRILLDERFSARIAIELHCKISDELLEPLLTETDNGHGDVIQAIWSVVAGRHVSW